MQIREKILDSLTFNEIFQKNQIHYGLKKLILEDQEELIDYFRALDGSGIKKIFFDIRSLSIGNLAEYLIELNQYFYIGQSFYKKMEGLYNKYLLRIIKALVAGDGPGSLLELKLMDGEILSYLRQSEEFNLMETRKKKLPNFQYEGESQLRILGIDLENLKEPILDVGCGKDHKLVRLLKSRGYDAFGLDRYRTNKDYIIRASWLDFDYGLDRWGSIIAHMSFSNHFYRESLKANGLYREYGESYMKILNSLKKGGSFYYSPSIEIIEEHLDENLYEVAYRNLENGYKVVKISKI